MAQLLDTVRSACRQVARMAELVEVKDEKLAGYAEMLLRQEGSSLEMDPSCHFLGQAEQTVAFLLTLDAVNFGSGYFPDIFSDPAQSGYRHVAASLNRHFREHGPIDAEGLCEASWRTCARIFDLNPDDPTVHELMELFARALRDLGLLLLKRFEGSFSRIIDAASGSAECLVKILVEMPLFQDSALYKTIRVPFLKRAQLAAADLHIAFGGMGPGTFRDLDRLTLFADNLVPHVLRHDGLLVYRPELADLIDGGGRIAAGSHPEVEIRACAVYAVERMVEELRIRGKTLDAMTLDNRLWHRGQHPAYRRLPRHRTRTPFY